MRTPNGRVELPTSGTTRRQGRQAAQSSGSSVSTMQSRERPDAPERLVVVPDLAPDPDANNAYPDPPAPVVAIGSARNTRTAKVTRLGAAAEAVVGLWLALSPWLIGAGGSSVLRWNDVAIGAGLVVLSLPRLVKPATPRAPVVSFGLGAWTIVAAFILSFQNGSTGTAPLWNAIACGAVLTAAAAWSTTETERAALRKD